MTITVKQLGDKFKYLKFKDFKKLTGKSSNIKDSDVVPLENIALFNKQDLHVFTAKLEGQKFVNLFDGERRVNLVKTIGGLPSGNNVNTATKTTNPFVGVQNSNRNFALGAFIPSEQRAWIG